MENNYLDIKAIQEDQKKLKACKTKEDLNNLWKGITIIVQDGSSWQNERCEFVEMVGEGDRKNWKMKVKTQYGTFLELSAGKVMIVTQIIQATTKEADKILAGLKKPNP